MNFQLCTSHIVSVDINLNKVADLFPVIDGLGKVDFISLALQCGMS